MSNAHEALGKDMHEKAAQEFGRCEGHHFLAILVPVILPSKLNFAIGGANES
jgi:hypothetical protein